MVVKQTGCPPETEGTLNNAGAIVVRHSKDGGYIENAWSSFRVPMMPKHQQPIRMPRKLLCLQSTDGMSYLYLSV